MNESKQDDQVLTPPDLESYINHRSLSRTISMGFVAVAILTAVIWFLSVTTQEVLSEDEFKAQFSFNTIESLWVVKNKINRSDFKGVLLVPQIRFRVRNESKRELGSVQMIGVFRFLNSGRSIGESIGYAFDKGAKPGEDSKELVMMTENGYEAVSAQELEKNRKFWEGAMVEIYAKTGRQKLTFIKSFYISRRIEGVDMDVLLRTQDGAE